MQHVRFAVVALQTRDLEHGVSQGRYPYRPRSRPGSSRHLVIGAVGQDVAALHHRDAVRQIGDHGQIVLDHQHRAVDRDAADQRDDAADILVSPCPEVGSSSSNSSGSSAQGRREFERALAAVGQFGGRQVRHRLRARPRPRSARARCVELAQHRVRAPEGIIVARETAAARCARFRAP